MKVIASSLVAFSALVILGGCGSSSSSSDVPVDGGDTPSYQGAFIDAAVANVSWACGTAEGVTNANGVFGICNTGEEVTFSLGALTLGSITPSADSDLLFTPQDIAGVARDGSSNDDAGNALASRIATLLISMDSDGDPSNGISITDDAVDALDNALGGESNISDKTQASIDQVITDTIAAVVAKDPTAGAAMNQVTVEEAATHLVETADAIVAGEITPPAQPDTSASLAWTDYTNFYFFSEEDEDDVFTLTTSILTLNHTTNEDTWADENYNRTTGEWDLDSSERYYLVDGEWLLEAPNSPTPAIFSADGLTYTSIWEDMKIKAVIDLAGTTRTISSYYGNIDVSFAEGDLEYIFNIKEKDEYAIYEVLKGWNTGATFTSIAAAMQLNPIASYHDDVTGYYKPIDFQRDATGCANINVEGGAPITGLEGELTIGESGNLVVYNYANDCAVTIIGTWSAETLGGEIALTTTANSAGEAYFTNEPGDIDYPLYTIKDGVVWKGYHGLATTEYSEAVDEIIFNQSVYTKIRAAIEAHTFVELFVGETLYTVYSDETLNRWFINELAFGAEGTVVVTVVPDYTEFEGSSQSGYNTVDNKTVKFYNPDGYVTLTCRDDSYSTCSYIFASYDGSVNTTGSQNLFTDLNDAKAFADAQPVQ